MEGKDLSKISIVEYAPKYKLMILDLFKKTFQKEMSKEFWKWRFEKNSFGKPIIKIALNKEKLVDSNSEISDSGIANNNSCLGCVCNKPKLCVASPCRPIPHQLGPQRNPLRVRP